MTPFRFSLVQVVGLMLVFLVVGCGGSGENPIAPGSPDQQITASSSGGVQPHSPAQNNRMLWGYYDIAIDPESGEIDVVPIRDAAFRLNVTMFLQPPLGDAANLGLAIVDASQFKTTGRIDLNISFTHPFPSLIKLRGFDVMGVFMGNGTLTGQRDPSVIYPASDGTEAYLINADGYTRWMNATEFTQSGLLGFTPGSKGIPGFTPSCTINGFKYYAENLGPIQDVSYYYQNPANVAGRGSFEAGSTLTREYEIQFPMSGGKPFIRFQYAILASWAKPDPASLPDPDVDDYPPEANLQEPTPGRISTAGTDLYYLNSSDFGGTLRVQIEVLDWQGPANSAGVPGEISHIWVEDTGGTMIPGGYIDVLPSVATVTPGGPISSVFSTDITGCTPHQAGPVGFLITVESTSPTDYDSGFGAPYPASAPLASFRRFNATVLSYNPCLTPTLTGPTGQTVNVNDVVTAMQITGTNFVSGPQLAAEFRGHTGGVVGTNVQVLSSTTAQADFDFSSVSAGMYDLRFVTGCGKPAQPLLSALEVNTPPTSTGITGPTSGDGTLGMVSYYSNATDSDTDPPDTLTYTWNVTDTVSMIVVIGPVSGDPLTFNFATLPVGTYDVSCLVSDGWPPADLDLHLIVVRLNTRPAVTTPSGPTPVWDNSSHTYNVTGAEVDPGQTLTYMWSVVPQGSPHSYTIAGDPTPGDLTIKFSTAPYITGPGYYEISCQVDDGTGAPNATGTSPSPLTIYVASQPYTDPIPLGKFNQVIVPGWPSLQGVASCASYWDSFYAPLFAVPFAHPEVTVLSGPSLGAAGQMVIADEIGVLVGGLPINAMGFAHYKAPFQSGAAPAWTWLTTRLWPGGPDMIPSVIHLDGNSLGEFLMTNSQLTGKLAAWGVPDMSAFSHYLAGGAYLNDLYTSLTAAGMPDVAVDATAGFDMGSPSSPMSAPLYGLFAQDLGGIINSCGGPIPGPLAPNPINIMMFPSMGIQPAGTPVDAPGSVATVAPIALLLTGPGPGLFNNLPGGPCPGGAMVFPEPYYALAVDDDPSDNLYGSSLMPPVNKWVLAATIDGDRDVEIYEMDFGLGPPGPAPLLPYATIPMGSFMGGNPSAYAVDCEFISNFSGFSGSPKPVWPEDLLAVLLTDQIGGLVLVEVYAVTPPAPTLVGVSMPIPTPPTIWLRPGVAFRLDVDEVTGDLYVTHDDAAATASMTVSMIPY